MIKFCRNCGGVLSNPLEKTCPHCQGSTSKATSYCRYCGKPTTPEDLICQNCGAAVKPVPNSIRLLNPDHVKLMRLGKIINLTLVVVFVVTYSIFAMPKSIRKPAAQAASDAVMASTGYSTLPLDRIQVTPPIIPELVTYGMTYVPPGIQVNVTRQLTVYAVYRNLIAVSNATKAVRIEDITGNCTYTSGNEKIATVNQSGTIKSTGPGTTNITIAYTAAPGSANFSTASLGKIPVTFTTTVTVIVK